MSRAAGWALALLPSRGRVSWPASLERDADEIVAGHACAKADAFLTTMIACELTRQLPETFDCRSDPSDLR
jgi:hypothetical protein